MEKMKNAINSLKAKLNELKNKKLSKKQIAILSSAAFVVVAGAVAVTAVALNSNQDDVIYQDVITQDEALASVSEGEASSAYTGADKNSPSSSAATNNSTQESNEPAAGTTKEKNVTTTEKKSSNGTTEKSTQRASSSNKNTGSGAFNNETTNNNSPTSGNSNNNNNNNTTENNNTNGGYTPAPTQAPTQKPTQKPAPTQKPTQAPTPDPNEGKTWHEAEYKYIEHPAETKTENVWVVDKAAYSYEEPVFEMKEVRICKGCEKDISHLNQNQLDEHGNSHILAGQKSGYYSDVREIQTGTKTIYVDEVGHWETKTIIIKEAWTEKVLVRPEGWY